MELEGIGSSALIRKEKPNKDQYFISILNEGYRRGLIDQPAMDRVQLGIMSIVEELIRKYTLRDSSSVKVEMGITILNSVYYILDAFTASLQRPEELIAVVQEKELRDVYKSGLAIVQSCVAETRQLYEKIFNGKLNLPLAIYNAMIDEDLPAFFEIYNVDFGAHDTPCSMDYPLVFDDMTIVGIFYIRQYLENLDLETQFCKCYRAESILKTLHAYGRKHRLDFMNAPVNLFEILFDQTIFSILSVQDGLGLPIPKLDLELVTINLSGSDHAKVQSLIDASVDKIIEDFDIQNQDLINYMHRYEKLFASRFLNACDYGNLYNMVLIDKDTQKDDKIIFENGDRMSNENFMQFIDSVLQCDSVEEKLAMISSELHSLEDYMDMLSADCLFGEEYQAAFNNLGDIELAVLGNIIFYEELNDGPFHLVPEKVPDYKKNAGADWQLNYIDFLFQIDIERRNEIEGLISKIINQRDEI